LEKTSILLFEGIGNFSFCGHGIDILSLYSWGVGDVYLAKYAGPCI